MTKEQIDHEFTALIEPQVNETAVRQLNSLVATIDMIGSWPENATPKPVVRLWK